MDFRIPQSLKAEHEELHDDLKKAVMAGGKVGPAAQAVAEALHAHFESEEALALPPLGLLPALAEGRISPEMAQVLPLTDRLKAELPRMLEEHQRIVAALKNLISAAKADKKPEHAHFAEKLMLHAQMEEEVTYPTAIVIGEYVKLRIG